ncbi:MAG: BACON domain-containing protein, partial [Planctomycetota bacterium]
MTRRCGTLECVALAAAALAAGCDWFEQDTDPYAYLAAAPGQLALYADESGPATTGAVALTYHGPGVVLWAATPDQPWLSVDVASGAIANGESIIITVTADPGALPVGIYVGNVHLEDSQGSLPGVTVTVTFAVTSLL